MADGLNKVTLIGYLGADPNHKVTQTNKDVCDFSLATTESWRGEDGNKQQATEWHRIVFWGKTATIIKQYLKKGSQVYIEGKLKTRKWTDSNGVEKYTTEVIGSKVIFLGDSQGQSNKSSGGGGNYNNHGGGQQSAPPAGSFGGNDDDIPF